jgi:hypothetical protein
MANPMEQLMKLKGKVAPPKGKPVPPKGKAPVAPVEVPAKKGCC